MKTNQMSIICLLLVVLLVSGCGAVSIKTLNEEPEKYLGKEIIIKGTVSDTFKIGDISGFILNKDNYSIGVSSKILPEENTEVTIKGILMKEILINYYIYAQKIY